MSCALATPEHELVTYNAASLSADMLNADTPRRTAHEVIRLALAQTHQPDRDHKLRPAIGSASASAGRARAGHPGRMDRHHLQHPRNCGVRQRTDQPSDTEPEKIPPRAGLDSRRAGTDRPGSRRVHPPGKTRPLARALDELQPDMWFSSLRRSQTAHRTTLHHFNPSSGNLLKACPLIDWSEADMDAYRHDHNLPGGHDYHDPTKAGPRRECGLHLQF